MEIPLFLDIFVGKVVSTQGNEEICQHITAAANEDEIGGSGGRERSSERSSDGGKGEHTDGCLGDVLEGALEGCDGQGAGAGRLRQIEGGTEAAGAAGLGEVDEGGGGGVVVLVADHSDNDMKVRSGLLGQLLDDILNSGGIVACVTDEGGVLAQLLPATAEAREFHNLSEAAGDGIRGDAGVEGLAAELGQGALDSAQVCALVAAFQLALHRRKGFLVGEAERGDLAVKGADLGGKTAGHTNGRGR